MFLKQYQKSFRRTEPNEQQIKVDKCSETNGHDAVHVTLIIKSIQLNMWIAEGSAFYLNYRKWQFSGTWPLHTTW